MKDSYKLTIELVPETVWFSNLRTAMTRPNWDKVRFKTYADYGHRCGICKCHPDRLECHEIWDYDDTNHIQYLKGFIALCVLCHNVKHIGLSKIKADEGRLDYGELVKHFTQVNNCSEDDFLQYRNVAFKQWDERSQYNWTQDFGEYTALIAEPGGQKNEVTP